MKTRPQIQLREAGSTTPGGGSSKGGLPVHSAPSFAVARVGFAGWVEVHADAPEPLGAQAAPSA